MNPRSDFINLCVGQRVTPTGLPCCCQRNPTYFKTLKNNSFKPTHIFFLFFFTQCKSVRYRCNPLCKAQAQAALLWLVSHCVCLTMVTLLPRKQHFTPGCQHADIVSYHTPHTHAYIHSVSLSHTRRVCKSKSNTLMWNHLSLSRLHKHTQTAGAKYYFTLSILKSGDDRRGEREKDTRSRCGFGLSCGVCGGLTSS